jgi:hypothetical protein
MYSVDISDGSEVDAQFSVHSPVLALDLVLRAVRAGLCWRAVAGPAALSLTLPALRGLAETYAAEEPREASFLRVVEEAEQLATAAARN